MEVPDQEIAEPVGESDKKEIDQPEKDRPVDDPALVDRQDESVVNNGNFMILQTAYSGYQYDSEDGTEGDGGFRAVHLGQQESTGSEEGGDQIEQQYAIPVAEPQGEQLVVDVSLVGREHELHLVQQRSWTASTVFRKEKIGRASCRERGGGAVVAAEGWM